MIIKEIKLIDWEMLKPHLDKLDPKQALLMKWLCKDKMTIQEMSNKTKESKEIWRWGGVTKTTVKGMCERVFAGIAINLLKDS